MVYRYRRSPAKSLLIIALLLITIVLAPRRAMESSAQFSPVSRPDIMRIVRNQHTDPLLVGSIITVESSWNASARSSRGAVGLMQVMPASARMVGLKYDAHDLLCPERNIEAGVRILKYYQQRYGLRLALHYYSGGTPGYYDKIMRARGKG